MTETKRCSGNKGEWACDYPDHMVPLDNFNRSGENGLQAKCRKCSKVYNDLSNPQTNPIHNPINNPKRYLWCEEAAKMLSVNKVSLNEFYSDLLTDEQRKKCRETVKLNKVIEFRPRVKSEFGQSTPMTKRETVKVEGEAVPEGWVYVVRNPDVPSVIKIGKTFPNGMRDIMSSARRFGRSELVDKFWFEKAYKAEQSIHTLLNHFNLRTLGRTDCGTELFKCTIEEAIDAITKVQSENDRPSVALGA